MARHRNVRSMNYSDEYDGYDDVYGHSVEDDFCVSPSEAAFMYNRESAKNQQIGAYIKDIAEEDEQAYQISENEQEKLESCIAQLKLVLGSSASKQEMAKALCDNNLNVDKALNILLDNVSGQSKQTEKKDKDDNLFRKPSKHFNIPKLSSFKSRKDDGDSTLTENTSAIPKFNNHVNAQTFLSLSDLSSNHLKNVKKINFNQTKSDKIFNNLSQKLSDIKLLEEENTDCSALTFPSITANPQHEIGNLDNSHQNIDLTKALTKNMWQKLTIGNNKKFDYLDMNCETKMELISDFNCTMDISYILDTSPTMSKRVSEFGKILCCRYKKYVPLILNDKQPCKFLFNVPSPDDKIKPYLKVK